MVEIRILGRGDDHLLDRVAFDVFDHPIIARSAREFLGDPRHHLAVGIEAGVVVGMVSAVHYLHPDQQEAELWINQVGVGADHRQRGIGTALIQRLLDLGRELGCTKSWVLTDDDNQAAKLLYARCGGVPAVRPAIMYEFDLKPQDADPPT